MMPATGPMIATPNFWLMSMPLAQDPSDQQFELTTAGIRLSLIACNGSTSNNAMFIDTDATIVMAMHTFTILGMSR